eukprot:3509103-Pyramimonas_sp.AAC.1
MGSLGGVISSRRSSRRPPCLQESQLAPACDKTETVTSPGTTSVDVPGAPAQRVERASAATSAERTICASRQTH